MNIMRGLLVLMLCALPLMAHAQQPAPSPTPASTALPPPTQESPPVPAHTEPAPPPRAEHHFDEYDTAVMQALDKPNARVQTFNVQVGHSATFGPLNVKIRACKKAPPEETPEAVAFVKIDDPRAKDMSRQNLYKGWMFASSPALSALEHPIYDVWVLDCKNSATKAASSPAPDAKAASPAKAKRKKP